jgi:hypothetical protein
MFLLKELAERVNEDENEDDDECVNCEGLDHRETDDKGCGDLTGCTRIPCNSFAGTA